MTIKSVDTIIEYRGVYVKVSCFLEKDRQFRDNPYDLYRTVRAKPIGSKIGVFGNTEATLDENNIETITIDSSEIKVFSETGDITTYERKTNLESARRRVMGEVDSNILIAFTYLILGYVLNFSSWQPPARTLSEQVQYCLKNIKSDIDTHIENRSIDIDVNEFKHGIEMEAVNIISDASVSGEQYDTSIDTTSSISSTSVTTQLEELEQVKQ